MQSILEQTIKTLHEAIAHPATEEHEQYTILDALRLLTHKALRGDVLKQLRDPYLLEWRARNAGGWRTEYPAEVGREVVALLGAFQLDSVDAVIREQKRLPLSQRRGALFVVDAMQTISRVEFESVLPELGRYVASLSVAMQSLSNLEALSPTMRDTLLDNGGCLTVFQVAGSDACDLLWELGADDSPRTTSSGSR